MSTRGFALKDDVGATGEGAHNAGGPAPASESRRGEAAVPRDKTSAFSPPGPVGAKIENGRRTAWKGKRVGKSGFLPHHTGLRIFKCDRRAALQTSHDYYHGVSEENVA